MKLLLIVLSLIFFNVTGFASDERYCSANLETVNEIEEIRFLEMQYKVLVKKVSLLLEKDSCVTSRISKDEIQTLSEMILSYDYKDDSVAHIIGEYLAQ